MMPTEGVSLLEKQLLTKYLFFICITAGKRSLPGEAMVPDPNNRVKRKKKA
jgi:hypothetical protein